MKFTEGVWNPREDIRVCNAVEVSTLSTHLDDSQTSLRNGSYCRPHIRATCTTRHIRHRGDLINKPTITVTVTTPAPGIIGIEACHFAGQPRYHEPSIELFPAWDDTNSPVGLSDAEDFICLHSGEGEVMARVDKRPKSFAINFVNARGEDITALGKDAISWILHSAASPLLASKENAATTIQDAYHRPPTSRRQGYMSMSLSLEHDEKVYGLGERFGAFIKNGQTIESSNDDGGSSSDSAYKCIPFYMTNRNYGVFVDHMDHVSFEVMSVKMTKVQISVPGERLQIYVIVGDSPKQVLTSYTSLTGRPPLPPDWSYGLWLSTSFLINYDEETVMGYVDRMAQHDIPLSVFHFDAFWMRPHAWCDFQFDPKFFPDPKGFLHRLHQKGIKVCVWINPWVGQASRLFPEGDRKGYFLKRIDGRTFQSDEWQPGCATVDFTNPDARKWWQGYLAELMDIGVDCFKTDFGEQIVTEDVRWFDGSNPRTMHNYYSFLYNEAVWEVLVDKRGAEGACVFARSATAGTQRFPVHWGGDVDSKFTGLAETIRGGLSLGLSGFGYHSSDIGGFKGEGKSGGDSGAVPPATIYKRWCQFGLLSSHSRLHGSGSPRVPWVIDDEACTVLSTFTKLKNRLEPYLTSQSIKGVVQKGIPLMRAMFLEFPQDRTCWLVDQQYMLGEHLLVAPVFEQTIVEYYLPSGTWTNILTGSEVEGSQWVKESHTMHTLPLMLRPGSALILGKEGHLVTDSIAKRGFTVIVSRQFRSKIRTVSALRDNQEVSVDISPKILDGRVVSLNFRASHTVAFDVVIIGNDRGLLDDGLTKASSRAGACSVKL